MGRGTRRTGPLHGHLVIGAKTKVLLSANPNNSMGPDSSFDAMKNNDFMLLLLGCNFHEGATYVHHAESMKGVPYREWLKLPRRIKQPNGTVVNSKFRYYGRIKNIPWETDLSSVESLVHQSGFAREVSIHMRSSFLMPLSDLNDCIFDMIENNPYALMRPR